MRLRRVKAEWGTGSFDIDFRGEAGRVLDVAAVIGGNGSGKSLLVNMVGQAFWTLSSEQFDKSLNGEIEYDLGGEIVAVMVQAGRIVHRCICTSTASGDSVHNGFLIYDSFTRSSLCARNFPRRDFSAGLVGQVLGDFHRGDIRNCVIMVDDFDLGLDDENASAFFQLLIRKALARDNQLIVTSRRASLVGGIPGTSLRKLGVGRSVIEEALKGLTG